MSDTVEVRNLTPEQTAQLVEWAAQEGWNPSPDDAAAFFAADPEGFLGCFVDGEFASGISAVSYGEDFGFIGLYITRPEFRGQGYGLKVWEAGLARLDGKTIGLDGVPAQQSNYEKMGFRRTYASRRWSGRLQEAETAAGIRAAKWQDIDTIMEFDRLYFPAQRASFLQDWLSQPRTTLVAEQNGRLEGYLVVRQCLEGYKIGPLFANDASTAGSLLKACCRITQGELVHLDIPDAQAEFVLTLQNFGFQSGFETARMYLGPSPQVDMSGVFAVTTLELG